MIPTLYISVTSMDLVWPSLGSHFGTGVPNGSQRRDFRFIYFTLYFKPKRRP